MDDEGLHVGDVGEEAEDLEMVDEFLRRLSAALDLEREDGDAAVGEIFLVERVIRMIRERGMVDLRDVRVLREVVDDLERVLDVALDAERERLRALQEQERVERRERRALIAQDERADVGRERRRADVLGEADAVVARVRLDELRELAALFPVELAAVDVPWPPMNFVALCTTMSAPYSNGRRRYGVANVLSTTSGILCLCAMAATASMSMRFAFGLPTDSM